MEQDVIYALKDAGEVVALLISAVVIIWLVTKVVALAIMKWSEAARERNMIEAKRNDTDERQAEAQEKLSDALTTVATHMEILSASQRQMAGMLSALAGQQEIAQREVKEGFEAMSAEGLQTRTAVVSGFEGVDKNMDDLQRELHTVSDKQDSMMADITTVKVQIDKLLQQAPPDLQDQLASLSAVTNRIWEAVQAMVSQQGGGTRDGDERKAAPPPTGAAGKSKPDEPTETKKEGD